jgi:hypothetical protein
MFQFLLKSDNNNGLFTWKPTCLSARLSDWVGNLQVTLVTVAAVITLVKGQKSKCDERSRIVTLYVHFLTCYTVLK